MKIKNILNNKFCFLDFETIDLDLNNPKIIEFACIIYDSITEESISDSFLIKQDNLPLNHITGISQEMLNNNGIDEQEAFIKIKEYISQSKYLIAHNGIEFDFKILSKFIDLKDNVLLDSKMHIPLKHPKDSQALKYKAFDYGIFNTQELHRALNDVELMKDLCLKYGINNMIDNANKKMVKLVACTCYNDRQMPKSANFKWESTMSSWTYLIEESKCNDFIKTLPFRVEVFNL